MAGNHDVARLLHAEQRDSGNSCYATQHLVSPTNHRVYIDSFIVEGQALQLNPPISFVLMLNIDEETIEVRGEHAYQDIFVYGDTLSDAVEILQTEILPILWEDCREEETALLSSRARQMAIDFRIRVIGQCL